MARRLVKAAGDVVAAVCGVAGEVKGSGVARAYFETARGPEEADVGARADCDRNAGRVRVAAGGSVGNGDGGRALVATSGDGERAACGYHGGQQAVAGRLVKAATDSVAAVYDVGREVKCLGVARADLQVARRGGIDDVGGDFYSD